MHPTDASPYPNTPDPTPPSTRSGESRKQIPYSAFPSLVLNADYQPLSFTPLSLWSWQEAIKAVFSGRVTVVESYDVKVRRGVVGGDSTTTTDEDDNVSNDNKDSNDNNDYYYYDDYYYK